jgi:hypothetical protein
LASWARQNFRPFASTDEPVVGSPARWLTRERLIVFFWLAAIAAIIILGATGPIGWDAQGYWNTVRAVHHNSDPYANDLAALHAYQGKLAANPAERQPFVYVYSPTTLPLLRLLGALPGWLLAVLYGAAVALGAILALWAGFQLADQSERPFVALVAPALIFFPGLVTDDVILSGNVAFPLYGVILAAATFGWKRGRWFWFYAAVVLASIFKTPFIALLAFPVLIDRQQWIRSCKTAIAALLLFAAQILLFPATFPEYLSSVRLVFDWMHDFGYGPAGTLARALWSPGQSPAFLVTILHLVFVAGLATVLLFLARHVRDENIPQQMRIPVALVGTFLLNPRIMKYDMAAITIPMLLIAWRGLRAILQNDGDSVVSSRHPLVIVGAMCFLVPNLMTIFGPAWWPVEVLVMLTVFALGARSIWQPELRPLSLAIPAELMVAAPELIEMAIPEEVL